MMLASVSTAVEIILLLIFLSAIYRFFIGYTSVYAANKVNEEVKKHQRAAKEKARNNQRQGNKTPDSEYVDFIEINDQD